MYKPFEDFFTQLQEKNEHKLSDRYKLLSPRMKKAVDEGFMTKANFDDLIIADTPNQLIDGILSNKRPSDTDWTNRLGL